MTARPIHTRLGVGQTAMLRGALAWAALGLIVCMAVGAAGSAVLQWSSVTGGNAALAERLAVLDRQRPDLAGLERRLAVLQAIDADGNGFEPGEDPERATMSFATDVQAAVAALGAALDAPRELPPVKDGDVTILHVELTGSAASSGLAPMIEALEAQATLTSVDEVQVSRSEPDRIAVRLLLRRYWARPS